MLASELRMKTKAAIIRRSIQRESELAIECEEEYARLLKHLAKLAGEGRYRGTYESNEEVCKYFGRRLNELGYTVLLETIPIQRNGRYVIIDSSWHSVREEPLYILIIKWGEVDL